MPAPKNKHHKAKRSSLYTLYVLTLNFFVWAVKYAVSTTQEFLQLKSASRKDTSLKVEDVHPKEQPLETLSVTLPNSTLINETREKALENLSSSANIALPLKKNSSNKKKKNSINSQKAPIITQPKTKEQEPKEPDLILDTVVKISKRPIKFGLLSTPKDIMNLIIPLLNTKDKLSLRASCKFFTKTFQVGYKPGFIRPRGFFSQFSRSKVESALNLEQFSTHKEFDIEDFFNQKLKKFENGKLNGNWFFKNLLNDTNGKLSADVLRMVIRDFRQFFEFKIKFICKKEYSNKLCQPNNNNPNVTFELRDYNDYSTFFYTPEQVKGANFFNGEGTLSILIFPSYLFFQNSSKQESYPYRGFNAIRTLFQTSTAGSKMKTTDFTPGAIEIDTGFHLATIKTHLNGKFEIIKFNEDRYLGIDSAITGSDKELDKESLMDYFLSKFHNQPRKITIAPKI